MLQLTKATKELWRSLLTEEQMCKASLDLRRLVGQRICVYLFNSHTILKEANCIEFLKV